MDFDKSSSSIVLDVAWGEVDRKNQGFIYAKNFPAMIHSIEHVLNKGKGNKLSLLSNTGRNVIDTFAKEKEFFKIYKDEFKEIFQGLVGKPFKDAVEGTFISGEMPKGIILEDIPEKFIEEPANSVNESPTKVKRRMKSLESRLGTLTEELNFKDDIIAEKDRELINLTRRLGEYKDKYEFLQRQFSFYKDHGEAHQNDNRNNVIDNVDEGEVDSQVEHIYEKRSSTKHEFIVSELKRKLQEQLMMISTLREQIKRGDDMGASYKKKMGDYTMDNLLTLGPGAIISLVILFSLTLFSLVFLYFSDWLHPNDIQPNRYIETSWWENNNFFSKLGWYFRDWKEDIIDPSSSGKSFDAYDKIFGISN